MTEFAFSGVGINSAPRHARPTWRWPCSISRTGRRARRLEFGRRGLGGRRRGGGGAGQRHRQLRSRIPAALHGLVGFKNTQAPTRRGASRWRPARHRLRDHPQRARRRCCCTRSSPSASCAWTRYRWPRDSRLMLDAMETPVAAAFRACAADDRAGRRADRVHRPAAAGRAAAPDPGRRPARRRELARTAGCWRATASATTRVGGRAHPPVARDHARGAGGAAMPRAPTGSVACRPRWPASTRAVATVPMTRRHLRCCSRRCRLLPRSTRGCCATLGGQPARRLRDQPALPCAGHRARGPDGWEPGRTRRPAAVAGAAARVALKACPGERTMSAATPEDSRSDRSGRRHPRHQCRCSTGWSSQHASRLAIGEDGRGRAAALDRQPGDAGRS